MWNWHMLLVHVDWDWDDGTCAKTASGLSSESGSASGGPWYHIKTKQKKNVLLTSYKESKGKGGEEWWNDKTHGPYVQVTRLKMEWVHVCDNVKTLWFWSISALVKKEAKGGTAYLPLLEGKFYKWISISSILTSRVRQTHLKNAVKQWKAEDRMKTILGAQ